MTTEGSNYHCTSPTFNNFVHEPTKNPDRDQAINIAVSILAQGKPVDIKTLSVMTRGRYKRNAARQAIKYISRHFAGQLVVMNDGGSPMLIPRGEG